MHLLVAETDTTEVRDLTDELREQGFSVEVAHTGTDLLATRTRPDLIMLGLELPDLDGLEVCRRLRARCQVPIIGMSRRDTELDRVLGLQAGLDDYVTKPFQVSELMARIGAVMRRVRPQAPDLIPRQDPIAAAETITHRRLRIDLRRREVWVNDRPIVLTRKEFDLLTLLASEPGTVFSRGQIMSRVWNDDSSLSSRTIDTHVGTLRAKLGERSWIVTVHGVGFRLGPAS